MMFILKPKKGGQVEMVIIGIDEAGYGPNLGPLVISGSVWSFKPENDEPGDEPTERLTGQLAERLVRCGVLSPSQREVEAGTAAIVVADSKALYKSGDSLDRLARSVLTVYGYLRKAGRGHHRLEIFSAEDCDSSTSLPPWDRDFREPFSEASPKVLSRFQTALASSKCDILDLRSRVVYPVVWNRLLERDVSKGTAHLRLVLGLMKELVAELPENETDVLILCDKLGARNRYLESLHDFFDAERFETLTEGAHCSEYRFQIGSRKMVVRFQVRGESFVPIGLASIASKYLRESAMLHFNAYWRKRLPELAPTAGYPVDARRFAEETASLRKELWVEDRYFWRQK